MPLCVVVDQGGPQAALHGSLLCVLQLEHGLDNADLCCGGVHAAERCPVVGDDTGANHVATSVDSSRGERDLQELRELLHVLRRGARVQQAAVVGQHGVTSYQHILG